LIRKYGMAGIIQPQMRRNERDVAEFS